MPSHRLHRFAVTFAFIGAVVASAAAAAAPVALIVDARGDVDPMPVPFSEASPGARYRLGASGEIIVMHYAACAETHLRGGDVAIDALGVETTGEVVSREQVECPADLRFSDDATAVAAVVMRGDGVPAALNPRPVFAILAKGVTAIEVRQDGKALGRITVDGPLARWPKNLPALTPGAVYELALIGGRGGVAAATVARGTGVTVVRR